MIYNSKYSDTSYGQIGISVNPDSLEDTKEVEPNEWYALFGMPRLSKVNSFIIIDEVFYITVLNPSGKKSVNYHVYRVSDKKYICPSTLDKEETISMVKRKYIELDI